MAKNIRKIIKKLPKKRQHAIEARAKVLIKNEMTLLTLRAQEELDKLGLNVDQL